MGDVYCRICGEPWDYYGLKHGDVEAGESERILRGEGCPCCDFGKNVTGNENHEDKYLEGLFNEIDEDPIIYL